LRGQRLGLPAITVFLHLGQAQFQALVLAFGRLALLLPLIPASLEEVDQLCKRTDKRKRSTGWHTSPPCKILNDPPWLPCHNKNDINGTKIAKRYQISFRPPRPGVLNSLQGFADENQRW
jgi:hypothetical protein